MRALCRTRRGLAPAGGASLTFSISTSESSFATGMRGRRSSRITDRRFQLLPDITEGPPPMVAGPASGPGPLVGPLWTVDLARDVSECHVTAGKDRATKYGVYGRASWRRRALAAPGAAMRCIHRVYRTRRYAGAGIARNQTQVSISIPFIETHMSRACQRFPEHKSWPRTCGCCALTHPPLLPHATTCCISPRARVHVHAPCGPACP